jgi:NDP-sugar pyrophosphorylase family protein
MVEENQDSKKTAFTVSVDYKVGLTTGVSATERANTVRALADGTVTHSDFIRPGHIFPLIADIGGLEARGGHTEAGVAFKPGTVDEWLDCGNKEVTVETNQRVLEHDAEAGRLQNLSSNFTDSVIIQPCYICPNVRIERSVVGPHVSLGEGTVLTNVNMSNCIVGNQTKLSGVNLSGAMIGSNAQYNGRSKDLSLGDFSTVNE